MRVSRFIAGSFSVLLLVTNLEAQALPEKGPRRSWDISVWIAGASGEENRNSFSEAQIISSGVFVGKVITDEIGSGWRRGKFEYGVDLVPVFVHLRPESLYGVGVEPIILRWNSGLHRGRVTPYVELAGGIVRTSSNLPAGDTSNLNFTARGGGGIQIVSANQQFLDIGCHWWHISNANLGNRNPEFNGIQLNLGYHWLK
jgi:Lipid A 3-O-deacylase (PagL)